MIDLKVQIYLAVLNEARNIAPAHLHAMGGLAAFAEKEAAKAIESINKLPDLKGECANTDKGKIEVGDVVRLKSGGPNMAVSTVDGNSVTCVWMLPNCEGEVADFHAATLEKVK